MFLFISGIIACLVCCGIVSRGSSIGRDLLGFRLGLLAGLEVSHYRILALVISASVFLTGCGKSSVQDNAYATANGAIKIVFQSGGKAAVTIAGQSADCTYSEENREIAVTCEGQSTIYTVNYDGSLGGPVDGSMAGDLTKQ